MTYEVAVNDEPLKDIAMFKDSLFRFEFNPEPNGIWFSIKNRTDKSAYLIWDGTYITNPKGNPYQALNQDLINDDTKQVLKEDFSSIIPSGKTYTRFTTMVTNVSLFEQNYTFVLKDSKGDIRSVRELYTKEYLHNKYWKTKTFYKGGGKKKRQENYEIEKRQILNYVKNNNQLGIGFTIELDGERLEYNFLLPIRRIHIYETYTSENSEGAKYLESLDL